MSTKSCDLVRGPYDGGTIRVNGPLPKVFYLERPCLRTSVRGPAGLPIVGEPAAYMTVAPKEPYAHEYVLRGDRYYYRRGGHQESKPF